MLAGSLAGNVCDRPKLGRMPTAVAVLVQGSGSLARPLNTSPEAVEEAFATLESVEGAACFGAAPSLPGTDRFLQADGCVLMLEYIAIAPGEKCGPPMHFNLCQYQGNTANSIVGPSSLFRVWTVRDAC